MFIPRVSIIVPVYNLEDFIEESVSSLLNQTYQNLEIILIDDGSKDASFSIIKKLAASDSRIVCVNQPNGGAASARNKGLSLATGEFILFVDGDDMLSPNAIADNIGYFEDDKIDWVAFSIKRVDIKGRYITHNLMYNGITFKNTEKVSSQDFIPYFYEERISGVVCGAIYRKEAILDIVFEEGMFYEDSIYFIDLLCQTNYAILSDKGEYLYVERTDSSQKAYMDFKHLASSLYAINKRLLLFRNKYPEYESFYCKDEIDFYYFLKNEKAKGNSAADYFIKEHKKRMKLPFKRNWMLDCKFFIYSVVGYKNIQRLLGCDNNL